VPQEVTEKILYEYELFGNTRFLVQMSLGAMPHDKNIARYRIAWNKGGPGCKKIH
jgi:hypothetical protein